MKNPVISGNLQLSQITPHTAMKMIWLHEYQKVVTADPGFTLSSNKARTTLRGKNITLSGALFFPFFVHLPNGNFAGSQMVLLKILSEKVGFKFQIKLEKFLFEWNPKSKKWMGALENVSICTVFLHMLLYSSIIHN